MLYLVAEPFQQIQKNAKKSKKYVLQSQFSELSRSAKSIKLINLRQTNLKPIAWQVAENCGGSRKTSPILYLIMKTKIHCFHKKLYVVPSCQSSLVIVICYIGALVVFFVHSAWQRNWCCSRNKKAQQSEHKKAFPGERSRRE